VADALAPVRGRKNLILFSRGIGELGTFGEYRKDPRYYTKTQEALNAANVAVYGVNTGPEPGLAILDGVSELASDTGGALYRIFVSFTTPLEQIAAATNGYYLLAVPTTRARSTVTLSNPPRALAERTRPRTTPLPAAMSKRRCAVAIPSCAAPGARGSG